MQSSISLKLTSQTITRIFRNWRNPYHMHLTRNMEMKISSSKQLTMIKTTSLSSNMMLSNSKIRRIAWISKIVHMFLRCSFLNSLAWMMISSTRQLKSRRLLRHIVITSINTGEKKIFLTNLMRSMLSTAKPDNYLSKEEISLELKPSFSNNYKT